MLPKRIVIKNFKSIEEDVIEIKKNFQTLVGINESGKSNILRAVSLIINDIEIEKNDIRDITYDENEIKEAYIRYVFDINDKLKNEIFKSISNITFSNDINADIVEKKDKRYNLKEYISLQKEVLFKIDLLNHSRRAQYWVIPTYERKIIQDWKINNKTLVQNINYKGQTRKKNEFTLINSLNNTEFDNSEYKDLTIGDLNSIIGNHITKSFLPYIPNCILWTYDDENLLPAAIELEKFRIDPTSCIPLQNMFLLAGYSDITNTIDAAMEKTNGIRNMLRKVGDNTTKHMKKVWPEWKKLKITLNENGDFIDAGIEDEFNFYSLERRSDGFKRFLTFLLMISAQNKAKKIYNNIIIIDEPDIGLHPSGINYLREELKKISEHNIVLISTHSIFMIDKEVVDRHLIVEKNKEITKTKRVESSNINDEEVIYRALNYSIYDLLKYKNIIFEGWKDKRFFILYKKSPTYKKLFHNISEPFGLLHAYGVKDIFRIANTCENLDREYIIISDSDSIAKQKKNKFKGRGEWNLYTDIKNVEAVTTEDFISTPYINLIVDKVLKKYSIKQKSSLDKSIKKDKLNYIRESLEKIELEKEKVKTMIDEIKDELIKNLQLKHIEKSYSHVVSHLFNKLANLKKTS